MVAEQVLNFRCSLASRMDLFFCPPTVSGAHKHGEHGFSLIVIIKELIRSLDFLWEMCRINDLV